MSKLHQNIIKQILASDRIMDIAEQFMVHWNTVSKI